ncbi:MAG TPA: hypothetical protein VF637_13245 [Sphingomicrobium sp.]
MKLEARHPQLIPCLVDGVADFLQIFNDGSDRFTHPAIVFVIEKPGFSGCGCAQRRDQRLSIFCLEFQALEIEASKSVSFGHCHPISPLNERLQSAVLPNAKRRAGSSVI